MHPKKLSFTKLSATGNDFVLIDNRDLLYRDDISALARFVCPRRTSIGADGLLCLEPDPQYDFALRYFNGDGTETECANGARAAAYYFVKHDRPGPTVRFLFGDHVYEAEVDGLWVKLLMSEPTALDLSPDILEDAFLEEGGFVNTGVPHYVLFSDGSAKLDVVKVGAYYRNHAGFQPAGTNVNFVECRDDTEISVRTYERGVEDETLSCGTGCVASALLAHLKKQLVFPMRVITRGGALLVTRHPDNERFYLEGQVKPVYEGQLPGS
jgi:diaminopimelate epimerase